MKYYKKVISLALLLVVALSVVTMLAFTPMKASAQSQDTVRITTSRDAWGKVWYNEEFYVDVTIVPPPSSTNVSLIVTVGSTTNVVNATRIAPTSATFRANFSIDTSGNLYWVVVKNGVTSRTLLTTLSEGDTITFSYGGINKTLTFEHTPATAVIRSSIPTYGIKFVGTQDWTIKAPDLNKNPYSEDTVYATLELFVFDPYKGTSTTETITVPFQETGPNTGEFAPVPTYTASNSTVFSASASSLGTTVTVPTTGSIKLGSNAEVSFQVKCINSTTVYIKPTVNKLYYMSNIELTNKSFTYVNDTFVKVSWTYSINLTMNGQTIQSWWLANITAYVNITTLSSGGYDVEIKDVNISSDVLSYYYAAFNAEVHSPDTVTVTVTVPTYIGSSYTDSYKATISPSQVAPSLSVSASLSGGVTITVNCSSFNYRSYAEDIIWATVYVGTNTTAQPVKLVETDVNTGIFEGTLPASILLKDLANGYLSGSINNISVSLPYWVELWNGTAWEFKSLTAYKTASLTYHLASISKTVPSQVTIGKTLLTIYLNDADLNLNPDAIDQPNTVTLSKGSLAIIPVDHTICGKTVEFGKLMLLATTKEGKEIPLEVRFPSATVSFIETGANTGVFKVSVNLAAFNLSASPESGDYVTGLKIVYEDYFNPSLEAKNVSITIPVISPSISVDRSTIPLTLIGNGPIVQVKIVDPEANLNPYVQDSLPLSNFKVYFVYANGVEEDVTSQIIKPSSVLETGPDTSTFIFNITIPKSLITPKLIGGKLLLQYETLTSHTLLQTEVPFEVYGVKILVNGTTTLSVSYGQHINITVISQDFNLYNSGNDSFKGSELQISGPDLIKNSVFTETGPSTGVFEAIIPVNASLGSPGEDITISIEDLTSPDTQYGYASWLTSSASVTVHIKAHLAKLIAPSEHGPYGVINITVIDPDLMYNNTAPLYIHWWNGTTKEYSISKISGSTDAFSMLLNISKYYKPSDVIGNSIVVMYYDTSTPSGEPVLLQKTIKFISWNPVITTNKEYYSVGQSINITVKDPDANTNPNVRETITVVIKSTAYPMGKTVTLLETGPDTGVFSGVVVITDNIANALKYSNYIYAKYGNEINISYYDEYPANFAQTGTGEWFTHTVYVGVPVTKPIVASKPEFVNPFTGQPITKPTVGVPVGISVNITNSGYEEKTFTVLMIVRNPSGVAVQISWVTVTLAAGAKQTVGFSFTPPSTGNYTVEIHIIASLAHPATLGSTVTTTLSVSA